MTFFSVAITDVDDVYELKMNGIPTGPTKRYQAVAKVLKEYAQRMEEHGDAYLDSLTSEPKFDGKTL